jgi:nanoRNase/pAp phosphatase (c-di-AMP/oligoRNAs hydrolase)
VKPATGGKSCRFLDALRDHGRVVVVMHDNPDPDAIATGWAVRVLIEERLGKPASLVAGGAIVRAENCHMVELLQPPLELVDDLPHDAGDAVVLVDCGLGTSNHLVTREAIRPVAVIDHHLNGKPGPPVPFMDLRPDVAASVTIAGDYLRQQQVEPGVKLATAMLYAIRTETRGFETHHTPLDREILLWLTQRADPAMIAEIENAPLSRDYFVDLALALQSTMVFGDTAMCLLPRAEGAEIVGELSDLLVRCRSLHRVLTGAVIGGDLIVSVRTQEASDNAARLVQSVLQGLGSGGGHHHRAGGKIAGLRTRGLSHEELKTELRQRWLRVCGLPPSSGLPLISRSDILQSL